MEIVELFFAEGEWARTIVSLIVGALLGATTSLLVQWRSNRAADKRQRQTELAKHCDELISLLRSARGLEVETTKDRKLRGYIEGFDGPFVQATTRIMMWVKRPQEFDEQRWEISDTFKDEHRARIATDPAYFREEGIDYWKTVVEAFNEYRNTIIRCFIDLPGGDEVAVHKNMKAAKSKYHEVVSESWKICEPKYDEYNRPTQGQVPLTSDGYIDFSDSS